MRVFQSRTFRKRLSGSFRRIAIGHVGQKQIAFREHAGISAIQTSFRLKELRNAELLDLPRSFPTSAITVSDWPETERAVIFSAGTVSIVDRDLNVGETLNSKDIDFDSSI